MNLKTTAQKVMRTRSGAVCAALVLLAVLIVINLLVSLIPYSLTQQDISGVGLYSLSGTSKAFLNKLDRDVTIYCLTSDGKTSDQLSTLLSRYQAESSHIKVVYVDAQNDPDFCARYGVDVNQITESSAVIASDKRYTFLDYNSLHYYQSSTSGKIGYAEYQYMYYFYSQQGASKFKALYGFDFSELEAYYAGDSKLTNAIAYVTKETLSYDFTLSDSTKQFVSSIDEPITVSCIWRGDIRECQISGMLGQLSALNPLVTVRFIDPDDAENAAFIEEHFDKSPDNLTILFEGEKRSATVAWSDVVLYHHEKLGTLTSSEYASYLSMESQFYSQLQGQIPYGYCYSYYLLYSGASSDQSSGLFNLAHVDTYFDGEETYLNALDYVTQATIPHAYIVTGSLGTPLGEKLADFLTEAGTEYETLSEETLTEIPEDAAVLFLYSPRRDLTSEETELLKDYLKNGGHLLLFTNAAQTGYANLMEVLSGYGVTASATTVCEESKSGYLEEADYLLPTMNTSHQINYYPSYAGYRVEMPSAHLLNIDKTLPANVTVKQILTTSEKGYITETVTGEDGVPTETVTKGKFPLAVDIKDSETGAAIVWYASTEMLAEELILDAEQEKELIGDDKDSGVTICGNKYFTALAVTYLGRSFTPAHTAVKPIATDVVNADTLSISAIRMNMDALDIDSSVPTVLSGILLILIIPFGILGAGIVVRSRRKKN